jgi:hypothetical protein
MKKIFLSIFLLINSIHIFAGVSGGGVSETFPQTVNKSVYFSQTVTINNLIVSRSITATTLNATSSVVSPIIQSGAVNQNGVFYLQNASGNTTVFIAATGNSYLTAGYLGVGISNPTVALDVNGTVKSTLSLPTTLQTPTIKALDSNGVKIQDQNSNYGVFVKDGGMVGIGTSNVNYALDVAGTINATWIIASNKVKGSLSSSYNVTATIISAKDTYYTVTANSVSTPWFVSKNVTINPINGTITVLKTGTYFILGRLSGLSGNVNDVIHVGISRNGAKPLGDYESEFTLLAASGKGGQSYGGIIDLNANDTISTQIENLTAANNITIKFYNLSLFRILD